MADFDIAIIGGGVIGLAIARQIALLSSTSKRRVVLIEQEDRIGKGISSRSSEVIHAGLYYPRSYLRSTLCVEGRERLYQYCRDHRIPHRKIGKLLVANSDAEHEFLHALALRAELNGVNDLRWLGKKQIGHIEPAVRAQAGFLSPSTGIIDSAALLRSLEKEIIEAGVDIALKTRITTITPAAITPGVQGFRIRCHDDSLFTARQVINSAGLQALAVAQSVSGFPAAQLPAMQWAKGSYFSYSGKNPFTHLVYPVPAGQSMTSPAAQHNSLGIHATLDLQGQLRFGPDLEIVGQEDYRVPADKREHFTAVIQAYFPALDPEKLQPAHAGIRPRLITDDKKTPDFLIQTAEQHGIPGLVNLFGIESPGLTCCLTLAQTVTELI